MILYKFSAPEPNTHFIEIEMSMEANSPTTVINLPQWRPGRYELGNFAKNIQRWKATNENGMELSFKKITKDSWQVETGQSKRLIIHYNYFAAQLDAGACWLDETQLYVNPIHCCLYIKDRIEENCALELHVPKKWQVATSLKKNKSHYIAASFHELVDSPFIASASLKYNHYEVGGKVFHIWFNGECKPDWQRVLKDFKAFTEVQLKAMKEFPFDEYHFLIQVVPYNFYHGVEHLNSTVIALGPGYDLMNDAIYFELLGVASHELFHVWNIKSIRPVEMLPYDYSKENYSECGFVYEGVTTYYGDLFLMRSGGFTVDQYLNEISVRLQKHMNNYGRFNYSVTQSSVDTWLDGYVPGIPDRKTSIYDEGSILALMLDLKIRQSTKNKKTLDDVMSVLYFDFAKKNRGYTKGDYRKIAEEVAGTNFEDFFTNYVDKAVSYDSLLSVLLESAGCEIQTISSAKNHERDLGFMIDSLSPAVKTGNVFPGSPSYKAGLTKGDEIISVNGYKAAPDFDKWLNYFLNEEVQLHVFRQGIKHKISLQPDGKKYYNQYKVVMKEQRTSEQISFFNSWISS